MNNRKDYVKDMAGFTLVEVMVTLVIVSMLIGVIGSFLVIHLKSFETTQSTIDIQYEAQLALNRLGKVAMESGGLSYISSNPATGIDNNMLESKSQIRDPYVIVFEYVSEGIEGDKVVFLYDNIYNRIVFTTIDTTQANPYDLVYNESMLNSEWFVFADYVDSWSVSPQMGISYEDSQSIYLNFDFEKNDSVISVSNTFKYRNKY